MTILADHQIRRLVHEHGMIDPFVPEQRRRHAGPDGECYPVISYGLSSYGYDCRLGTEFKLAYDPKGPRGVLDPKAPDWMMFDQFTVNDGLPVELPAHAFILAHTVEYFKMPPDVTGQVWGKSTYARAGIHVLVTPIEAGWEGQITLEIANLTPRPVRLYPGEGICQIVFYQGEPCERPYDATRKYFGQVGVTLGKV